jgi:hypothetical protein
LSALNRIRTIQATYSTEIASAALRLGDHAGVNEGTIAGWISNFSDSDLDLAVKVLGKIEYYSFANIWSMIVQLTKIVEIGFAPIPMDKIIFVPIGGPYSGSATIARVLRDTKVVPKKNIKYMAELEKMSSSHVEALAFVEDFSGTGNSLSDWWKMVEPIVLPRGVPFALALLVVNWVARRVIEKTIDRVYCIDELDRTHNVLSPNSRRFDLHERSRLRHYCQKTGSRHVGGYGNCGLLLAFKHGCPNNSLPILWQGSPEWKSLFKRRDT